MKVGIAGPISLKLINQDFDEFEIPEKHYEFPFMASLVNGLLEKGIEVVVYTNALGIDNPIVIEKEKITICIGRRRQSPGRRFFNIEINDLAELMRKHPSDIINAQWTYEFALASLKSKIPTVITVRDNARVVLKYGFDIYRIIRWIMNYVAIKKANHFIANSDYIKNLLKNKGDRIRVINNFYSADLEKHYRIKTKKKLIITTISTGAGKLKNIRNALRAFKIIKKEFPQIEYHLIGKPLAEYSYAYNFAEKYDLLDGVKFLGKQPFEKVIDQIKHSVILLHPSREESFGNTILESMVIGTAVVAGKNSGNVPYLLDHGNAGVLCNVNSPKNIAEEVIGLLKDSAKLNQLPKTASKFAKENFNQSKIIDQLIEYYRELIEAKT